MTPEILNKFRESIEWRPEFGERPEILNIVENWLIENCVLRSEILEKIDKKKKDTTGISHIEENQSDWDNRIIGYNQALEDIKEIIK